MERNRLLGALDQAVGIGRELWGEISGNGQVFEAGLRQRVIGQVESCFNLGQHEAEDKIDTLKH